MGQPETILTALQLGLTAAFSGLSVSGFVFGSFLERVEFFQKAILKPAIVRVGGFLDLLERLGVARLSE